MTRSTPKKSQKPPEEPPRKGRRREDAGEVGVKAINPPAVGGGGIQRGEGPKKK
jgi:hypothetical protein